MWLIVRSFAVLTVALLFGAVFGPVIIALVAAAIEPETDSYGFPIESSKLIDAYQDRLPPRRIFLTIMPPDDGAECGYDPEIVFPDGMERMFEARQKGFYADYQGYYALDRWRGENRDRDWIEAIASKLGEQMSPFQAGFLRRCIESTLFADLCMKEVERFGDAVPRFSDDWRGHTLVGGYEDRVVCTFVDGVAARKGITLADRAGNAD